MSVTRYLAGMFLALLVMMTGEARADTRVLVDLYPEWQVREACRLMEREGDLPPWWADVCGEPIPPVSPSLPPVSEDDGEEPPLPPSGCWTAPSGQRLCPGEDGRAYKLVDGGGNIEWISPREAERPTLEEFAAYLHATGWYDTEDNTDNESTPTLEDPSEREGFTEHNPLSTEYRSPAIEVPPLVWVEHVEPPTPEPTPSETPTAAPVEPTPAACPPGTTPMFGGLLCLDYWTPGGDWRVDWGIEPDLREVEHGQPCGQEGEPPCPGANHPQPEPCPPNREPCNLGCCWEAGRPPPDGEVVVD